MTHIPKAPTPLTPGEKAAEKSKTEAEAAVKLDKNPDAPGKIPDNVSFVEGKVAPPVARSSHSRQVITVELLARMTTQEIRAVAHDRDYWKQGTHVGRTELVRKFLECQDADQTLGRPPVDTQPKP